MKPDENPGKRPYTKPEVRSETYMERAALGCQKIPEQADDPCQENGQSPKSGA